MSQASAPTRDAAALVEGARRRLEGAAPQAVLAWAFEVFPNERVALCTSLQQEGLVLLDMAVKINPEVQVFTIDSGRLPQATLDLVDEVRDRYHIGIEVLNPDGDEVSSMVSMHGPNLFYKSPELRLSCCEIRKVRPLNRKLANLDAWVSGLRRDQNTVRCDVRPVHLDEVHGGIVKLNPLAGWTDDQVRSYVAEHRLPQNALYSQGYTSIGCEPCTRPTEPGEDPRAGRWWWEQGARECGLHYRLTVDASGATRVASRRGATEADDRAAVPDVENA